MQEAPNAEGIHGFIHNNGESPRSIATLHPLPLLLLLLLLLPTGAPQCPNILCPILCNLANFVTLLSVLKCCLLFAIGFYMKMVDDGCCLFACVWLVGGKKDISEHGDPRTSM